MTTKEIIDNWLNDTQTDLVKNYDRLGLRASGNWANQLEQFNTKSGNLYKLGILGEKYTGAIEFGRNANYNQTEKAIKRWVGWAGSTFIKEWTKKKGIPETASYAIAYKIAREGWKVPNRFNAGGLVSDVVTQSRISELMKSLSLYFIQEIKTDMVNTLENGSNIN